MACACDTTRGPDGELEILPCATCTLRDLERTLREIPSLRPAYAGRLQVLQLEAQREARR